METKRLIRKNSLEKRSGLSIEQWTSYSDIIELKLLELADYKQADAILCYADYKGEVRTTSFMERALLDGKEVACPRVNGKKDGVMEFYQVSSLNELDSGYKGILEPIGAIPYVPEKRCLMVLPGAAFDASGNRIGYGKGYYDRYLDRYPKIHTVGICFECQLVDAVPATEYDWVMDRVITESGGL